MLYQCRHYLRSVHVMIVIASVFVICLVYYLNEMLSQKYYSIGQFSRSSPFLLLKTKQVKNILFWYEPFKTQNRKTITNGQGPNNAFQWNTEDRRLKDCEFECEIYNRDFTASENELEKYDAIVFHQRDWTSTDVPKIRWIHQRYIFLSMESPAWRTIDTESMADFFNWTMTYRKDSDVYNPYGWFRNLSNSELNLQLESAKQQNEISSTFNYSAGKTKKVAWFVSNCVSQSARNEYVKLLKTFIDVDIYGQCGTFRCSRSNQTACREMLERDYKFYLALENSLCEDYVTEKFFNQLQFNIVPIIFDLHGNHKRLAPPHSFINAADFPSVQHLADYLKVLDLNDTLYNEYFWWKRHFTVQNSAGGSEHGMCHLCKLLHDSTMPNKVYINMTDWWDSKSKCQSLRFDNTSYESLKLVPSKWKSFFL